MHRHLNHILKKRKVSNNAFVCRQGLSLANAANYATSRHPPHIVFNLPSENLSVWKRANLTAFVVSCNEHNLNKQLQAKPIDIKFSAFCNCPHNKGSKQVLPAKIQFGVLRFRLALAHAAAPKSASCSAPRPQLTNTWCSPHGAESSEGEKGPGEVHSTDWACCPTRGGPAPRDRSKLSKQEVWAWFLNSSQSRQMPDHRVFFQVFEKLLPLLLSRLQHWQQQWGDLAAVNEGKEKIVPIITKHQVDLI